MNSKPTTAILLFSRTAAAEAGHKAFGAGEVGDVRIAQALIARTEAMLSRTGLPVVRIDESKQRGHDFGTRIAEALADTFACGYQQLLVVGNDAPELRVSHLRAAAAKVADGHDVIVPDRRGGIVLLGINAARFNATKLASLAWESGNLRREIQELLPGTLQMAAVGDINTLTDLRRAWSRLRSILATIFHLLNETVLPVLYPETFRTRAVCTAPGRAPPVA